MEIKLNDSQITKLVEILSENSEFTPTQIVEDALRKYFSRLDVKFQICKTLLEQSWAEKDIVVLFRGFGTELLTRRAIKEARHLCSIVTPRPIKEVKP